MKRECEEYLRAPSTERVWLERACNKSVQRMMTCLVFAVAANFGIANAQEPLTFKGFALGVDKSSFLAAIPGQKCKPDGEMCFSFPSKECSYADPETSVCFKALSYGGFLPESILSTFRDDRLVHVLVSFPTQRFAPLVAALLEKFGKPTRDERVVLQNRMGAKFQSREVRWARGGAILLISERANGVDEGAVILSSIEGIRQAERDRQQKAKEAAKNL